MPTSRVPFRTAILACTAVAIVWAVAEQPASAGLLLSGQAATMQPVKVSQGMVASKPDPVMQQVPAGDGSMGTESDGLTTSGSSGISPGLASAAGLPKPDRVGQVLAERRLIRCSPCFPGLFRPPRSNAFGLAGTPLVARGSAAIGLD